MRNCKPTLFANRLLILPGNEVPFRSFSHSGAEVRIALQWGMRVRPVGRLSAPTFLPLFLSFFLVGGIGEVRALREEYIALATDSECK